MDDIEKWTQLADYFGSGLDVWDAALAGLFPYGFSVQLLGRSGVYSFSKADLERR